ncbi:hypothetical protein C7T94_01190 [Pedobacter yulinensis]|uniref:DUF748 domain-containing protein n=1 Tax=Pedobacter yulinensis TaxID=2126353 RepID=A0A2T3HQN4_9SPHI|nr:hypothetical protein [Pedobacter yulinensis]PST84770.1 hypothetical protein C7T94_01190 [Pedobacter yulinensis]
MPGKKRLRYILIKWGALALALTAALLTATSWYLNQKYRPFLSQKVRELVYSGSDSLYRIEFDNLHTNFLTGSISLSHVRIVPDTLRYAVKVANQTAPNNLYYVFLNKLLIRHIHPHRLLRENRLNIGQIIFEKPRITMINRQLPFNENRPPRPVRSPYQYISRFVKEFRVETINFRNASFHYVNANEAGRPRRDSIDNLHISLKDLLIDPGAARDTSRVYLLKDISISLNDYSYKTADGFYKINLRHLGFNLKRSSLRIRKLELEPQYSESAFGEKAGYARDRYHVELNDIDLGKIDLPLYVRKQELLAGTMAISNGSVSVFNNNALPPGQATLKEGRYPHQLLQTLPIPITLRKILIRNIDIAYAEFDRDSRRTGKITFQRSAGTITNVTNVPAQKQKNRLMQANLHSYLMGRGLLRVRFNFDLLARDAAFGFKGTLMRTDGRLLNKITVPLGMVKVKRGTIQKLAFDIRANDSLARGRIDFAYNNLSVALMRKNESNGNLVSQGWASLLANALVLNSDNPDSSGLFIYAPVHYVRTPSGSFFNLVWRSIFQGVKHSVGLTPQKEEEIRTRMAEFEKMKSDRQERREQREQRRRKDRYR